ncbi:alcohol dehydrogenase [Aeropyrum pernix K1]|uniref:Alcohol dehydrogenase n=1 Tax=Aeropyrum pernix (strain ATCC 700893 / DSM 11879 / JCM 9820 / NBRC 100138 / K1) TaxID=272557 RepID=Q9YAH6_AERPE|nr:iron-containing alcohol dehydrogenase [Aeropyrum pernix]BAA80973.2 alcohol dehydrogenase [Aeropyrum pernix K1]
MVDFVFPRRIVYNESLPRALETLLGDKGVKHVLVVTDGKVAAMSWFKEAVEHVASLGVEVCIFDGVTPEPEFDVGDAIASEARRCRAEAIVAVGGGSVIDAAKAGFVKFVRPDADLEGLAPFNYLGLEDSGIVLVAVPTTSGTGSDASYGIVLTKRVNGGREKIAVGSYEVVPYASILDPSITLGMPERLTVGTAVDALAHSVEAIASTNANPLSDALAAKAAEIVFRRLPEVVNDPGNYDARAEMHIAATMAGMAFTNSGLGLAHAIAHPLGARLGTHHGATVGMVLPHVVRFNESRSDYARRKYWELKLLLESLLGLEERGSLADHIEELYARVGQPTRVRELAGIERERYLTLADEVAEAAFRDPELAFNPVMPTMEDVKTLLYNMY